MLVGTQTISKTRKVFLQPSQSRILGHDVKEGHVRMDLIKLTAIKEWKPPSLIKGVQSFIGFCNFAKSSSLISPQLPDPSMT